MKDEQEPLGRTSQETVRGRENDRYKVKEPHRTSTMEIVRRVGTTDLAKRGGGGHLMEGLVWSLEDLERGSTRLDFGHVYLMGVRWLDLGREGELGSLRSHPKEKRNGSGNGEEKNLRAMK